MPASRQLIQLVGHALRHLYDPDVLRVHPLISAWGLNDLANPQAELRDVLTSAIEALRPEPAVPVNSRTWRVYKILSCRFVQQMEQNETADQVGVSVRQLRREQSMAVTALADSLAGRDLASSAKSWNSAMDPGPQIVNELAWLRSSVGETSALVQETLQAAVNLAAPLAANWNARLTLLPLPPLPPVAIHPAGLRQVILSLVAYALHHGRGGSVSLSADRESAQVFLRIAVETRSSATPTTADSTASISAAESILSMYGAQLKADEQAGLLSLTVTLVASESVSVLAVDDNADVAQLFTRYVVGTRYHLQCISGVERLFETVAAIKPQVIILDIMIPGVDGWEILGRLRQHPLTSSVPIIVCTVLPEHEFALALGATAFLSKPVARSQLLSALDQTLRGEQPMLH